MDLPRWSRQGLVLKLSLRRSPHTTDVIKGSNVTIYAFRDEEDSEEIWKALDRKEGDGVVCLGKP